MHEHVDEHGTATPIDRDRHDGDINFSSYSIAQLKELQAVLDRHVYPKNYENLLDELRKRQESPSASITNSIYAGRYTQASGFRGWYQALLARSPVFGSGSIEVGQGEINLNGWRLTWLGAAIESCDARPLSDVRNAVEGGHEVHFQLKRRVFPHQIVRFTPESPEMASQIVDKLPRTSTPGFVSRWTAIRNFHRNLALIGGPPWITASIIAANCLVFLLMATVTKGIGPFGVQDLLGWGANFGPLTVNGQWWRLLSALFVHFNLLHITLNMWALWNMGRLTERLFGHWTFVVLYLASGLIASLTSIAWDPSLSSVGASGAIFGIFGAFLAFIVRRGADIPASLRLKHWMSTTAFVVFNLVSGAVQPAIDNASHIGGLLAGWVIGYMLSRPIDPRVRRSVSGRQGLAASSFILVVVAIAAWQITGIGSEMTPSERYLRNHQNYVDGESSNLRLWNTLSARAATGSISDADLATLIDQDVIPFWRDQKAKLEAENATLTPPQRAFGLLLARFVDLRYQWATAVVQSIRQHDPDEMKKVQRLQAEASLVHADIARIGLRSHMDHRPRALASNRFFSAARQILSGYHWKCIDAPAYSVLAVSASDSKLDGPAMRRSLACHAQELFMTGDYARLELLLNLASNTLEDLPDGSSRLQALTEGLSNLFQYSGQDVDIYLGRTADWRRQVKTSVMAELVESMVLSDWAWDARGHGSANQVSAQNMALFSYRSEMARAGLAEIADKASKNPIWYVLSIEVGLDQSKRVDELRTLFNQGVAVAPNYVPLYHALLRILMPRWLGSYDDVDQFINQIRTTAADGRGYEHYAQLYSLYAAMEGDDTDLFRDTRAFWSGMQMGFRGLVQRYPGSDYWLNRFAHFACRAEDESEYVGLRDAVGRRYSASAWTTKYSLDSCDKTFAALPADKHARPAARDDDTTPGSQMRVLGGIRIGMKQADLLRVKGVPIFQQDQDWVYNSIDATHNGVVTAWFSLPGRNPDATVTAVEYSGDIASEPPELPDLLDMSSVDVIRRYGAQLDGQLTLHGNMTFRFKNGVYVDTVDERVRRYGIFAPP